MGGGGEIMTVHVPDDPSEMDLPFWGKVRVGKRGRYVIWGPAVIWEEGCRDTDGSWIGDVQYCAWINGKSWNVPDPLQTPHWPWHPCDPDEWLSLYREWEKPNAA